MMAATSGSASGGAGGLASTTEARVEAGGGADDEFGSFAAAERLSDPFGDVYGADADFGDFVGGASGQKPDEATGSSSLLEFSPLTGPAASAPPTLLPSISGEVDPFADITGGRGAADNGQTTGTIGVGGDSLSSVAAAPTSTPSATSAILDLVWGNTSQEMNPLASSTASVGSASGGSRTASNPSGFTLPPPPSSKFATFPQAASTPEASTGDLLSFSPVQASAPSDPFFGISNDTTETSAAPAFGDDDLLALATETPLSTTSSSAPTSLHGSFASLHEAAKPPLASPTTPGSVEFTSSPRDPFAERTTRSFGSLNSSFVSAGAAEEPSGKHASFGAITTAAAGITESTSSSVTPSPSSAPPSLRSSFKNTDGFMGFSSSADTSDEVDPFAEAGLAAPEEVPLAEALAAWNTSADSDKNDDQERSVEQEEVAGKEQKQTESLSSDCQRSMSSNGGKDNTFFAGDQAATASTDSALDAWHNVATFSVSEHTEVDDSAHTREQELADSTAADDFAAAPDSETITRQSLMFSGSTDSAVESSETSIHRAIPTEENDSEVHALGLQDGAFDDDESESDENDVQLVSGDERAEGKDKEYVVETKDPFNPSPVNVPSFSVPALDSVAIEPLRNDVLVNDSSPQHDSFSGLRAIGTAEFAGDFNYAGVKEAKSIQDQPSKLDENDDFGDFGGFEAASPAVSAPTVSNTPAAWGSFPSPTPAKDMPIEDEDDGFGDFSVAAPPAPATFEDDGFADFAQSTEAGGDDEFGDFGDFAQSSTDNADDFTDFQHSTSGGAEGDDNDFGDFAPAAAPMVPAAAVAAPPLSKNELSSFFKEAFPTRPVPTASLDQPSSPRDMKDLDVVQEPSADFVQDVFRSMWDEYISVVAATGRQSASSSGSISSAPETSDSGERVRLGKKTARASKYLKYVLSEKIQEASRQNGIFPHGSERHQMYVGYAASGDANRMRAALKELQDALFHNSVNDAMMRIAKQAALSAKAKIAEQAAQQQASSRGGSLFSTTRHLLSRGGNATSGHGPGSSGNDNKADHAGADTPTGASVQKLARFSFTNAHDEATNSHRGANAEERGSEGSDHTGHSSGSDSEVSAAAGDSRTRSQTNSGSSNGGLMKKFQDRFSFASSRHRPRFVSLRRKGQSGEEVRKMELNLDAISGGLDEVKWKCAMFLYDVEEVAHVAPSQISILAYPSKQPLTGKTDRSALTKLVKPDTVWTVDIGANNSDMLNEW